MFNHVFNVDFFDCTFTLALEWLEPQHHHSLKPSLPRSIAH